MLTMLLAVEAGPGTVKNGPGYDEDDDVEFLVSWSCSCSWSSGSIVLSEASDEARSRVAVPESADVLFFRDEDGEELVVDEDGDEE
jgi:hypothetical protein